MAVNEIVILGLIVCHTLNLIRLRALIWYCHYFLFSVKHLLISIILKARPQLLTFKHVTMSTYASYAAVGWCSFTRLGAAHIDTAAPVCSSLLQCVSLQQSWLQLQILLHSLLQPAAGLCHHRYPPVCLATALVTT